MTRFYIDDSDEDSTFEEIKCNSTDMKRKLLDDEDSNETQMAMNSKRRKEIENDNNGVSGNSESSISAPREGINNGEGNEETDTGNIIQTCDRTEESTGTDVESRGNSQSSNTFGKWKTAKVKRSGRKYTPMKIRSINAQTKTSFMNVDLSDAKLISSTNEEEKMDVDMEKMEDSSQTSDDYPSDTSMCEVIAVVRSEKTASMMPNQHRQSKFRNVRWYKERKNQIIRKLLARSDVQPIIKDMLRKLAACSEVVSIKPCDFQHLMFAILNYDKKKHSDNVTNLLKLVRHDFLNLNREIQRVNPKYSLSLARKSSQAIRKQKSKRRKRKISNTSRM